MYGHATDDNVEIGCGFNLKNLLNYCQDKKICGIFTCNFSSIALTGMGDCIGVFDSHSRDFNGKIQCDGVACLNVKENSGDLFETIMFNIPKLKSDHIANYQYEFTEVSFKEKNDEDFDRSVGETV